MVKPDIVVNRTHADEHICIARRVALTIALVVIVTILLTLASVARHS